MDVLASPGVLVGQRIRRSNAVVGDMGGPGRTVPVPQFMSPRRIWVPSGRRQLRGERRWRLNGIDDSPEREVVQQYVQVAGALDDQLAGRPLGHVQHDTVLVLFEHANVRQRDVLPRKAALYRDAMARDMKRSVVDDAPLGSVLGQSASLLRLSEGESCQHRCGDDRCVTPHEERQLLGSRVLLVVYADHERHPGKLLLADAERDSGRHRLKSCASAQQVGELDCCVMRCLGIDCHGSVAERTTFGVHGHFPEQNHDALHESPDRTDPASDDGDRDLDPTLLVVTQIEAVHAESTEEDAE